MKVIIRAVILTLLSFTLINCTYAAGGKTNKEKSNGKGAPRKMITYRIGRFAIDVPTEFRLAHRKHQFRLVNIEEFSVPDPRTSVQYAEQKWKERLLQIGKLDKPSGVKEVVIKQQTFRDLGHWSNAVLYYHDYMTERRGCWEVWVDFGRHVTVFKLIGLISAQENMLSWMMEVVRSYRPDATASGRLRPFQTGLGEINLPYKRQESSVLRFDGPKGMAFRVQMNETHKVETTGVLERLAASMRVNYAPGVEVEKIRASKRTAAGLAGEEIITRLTDKHGKELFLAWEYPGKQNSGECPEIRIAIEECPDVSVGEMVDMWDGILDSFRVTDGAGGSHG